MSMKTAMQQHTENFPPLRAVFERRGYKAKFVTGSVFKELLKSFETSPALSELFDSIEIYSDTSLTKMTKKAKREIKEVASRDPFLINELLRLKHDPLLNEHQFEALKLLLDSKLRLSVFKRNQLPHIMIATPSKYSDAKMQLTLLICRNCREERHFTCDKLAKLQARIPKLVSLKLHSTTMDLCLLENVKPNITIRYLDIKLHSLPKNLVEFFSNILEYYSSHLKEFTLEQLAPILQHDKAYDTPAALSKKVDTITFPKLKTLRIGNMHPYPKLTAEFVECIVSSAKKLKQLSLDGLHYSSLLCKPISFYCKDTLTDLSIDIGNEIDLMNLAKLEKLKHLRCRLSQSLIHLTVVDVLKCLPQLEKLNFGFYLYHSDIRFTIHDQETFSNILTLTLENLTYDKRTINKLRAMLPNSERIICHNCNKIETDINLSSEQDPSLFNVDAKDKANFKSESIEDLSVDGKHINNKDEESIVDLTGMKKIVEEDLSSMFCQTDETPMEGHGNSSNEDDTDDDSVIIIDLTKSHRKHIDHSNQIQSDKCHTPDIVGSELIIIDDDDPEEGFYNPPQSNADDYMELANNAEQSIDEAGTEANEEQDIESKIETKESQIVNIVPNEETSAIEGIIIKKETVEINEFGVKTEQLELYGDTNHLVAEDSSDNTQESSEESEDESDYSLYGYPENQYSEKECIKKLGQFAIKRASLEKRRRKARKRTRLEYTEISDEEDDGIKSFFDRVKKLRPVIRIKY